MIILGAGMAGCIAGIVNKDAMIFEEAPKPTVNHQALLRFRDESVGNAVGIPFRKVTVQKSIWYNGEDVMPSPRFTHLYAMKVIGRYMSRSIADVTDDVRFVAPHDFHEQMIAKLDGRILYDCSAAEVTADLVRFIGQGAEGSGDWNTHGEATVSTLPLYVNANLANMTLHLPTPIGGGEIYISQYRVNHCDSFATVYFPGATPVYRASVSGDLLIVESMMPIDASCLDDVLNAFGFDAGFGKELFTNQTHSNGKIAPMNEGVRRNFIHDLTTKCNVYSLGRYATWRNIILDDVLKDIYVINKMISMDAYSLRRGH